MLEELGIHTIQIMGGIRKGIHITQTRGQNESHLTTIYKAYIDRNGIRMRRGTRTVHMKQKNTTTVIFF